VASGWLTALAGVGTLPVPAWLAVLAHPARPWDLRPVDDDPPAPAGPTAWPDVDVIVPARNEAETLPITLPALLAQDYPGQWRVVLVDDRSSDGTAELAVALGRGAPPGLLDVVAGCDPPDGWVGKVWALAQGERHAAGRQSRWTLLTDADILHAQDSLRRLVAEAEARDLALDSRMARLRCRSPAERLLVPAFVLFFYLLFPPRWANRAGSRTSSAAGGCILVRRDALERAGGFAAIRGALIDDLALARRVKRSLGLRTRIATSRSAVTSVRGYETVGGVWRMVRRSAFTQLRGSWALLGGVLVAIALLFVVPPLALAAGVGLTVANAGGAAGPWLAAAGLAAWLLMIVVALPAVRFFGLPGRWAVPMPVAGALYGAMTLDSALRGTTRAGGWRSP